MADPSSHDVDHAVDDIKRALGGNERPDHPSAVGIFPTASTDHQSLDSDPSSNSRHNAAPALRTLQRQRTSTRSDTFSLLDNLEEEDRSNEGLVKKSSTPRSSTKTKPSAHSMEEEDLVGLDDEKDDSSPKTLFEPLKEGSKDKVWGTPSIGKIRRLIALGRPELLKITFATIALLIGSLSNLALPKLIGGVMDAMAKPKTGTPEEIRAEGMSMMKLLMIKLAIIFALMAISSWIRQTLFAMAGEKIVANLRRQLFDKLLTMEIAFYDVNRTGELVNRLASDTTLIQSTVTTNVSQLLRNLALVIGGLAILFSISWKLTMLMFVILPLLGGVAFGYGRFIKTLSKKVQDVLASATTVAEETLGAMRTVKSFGAEGKEGERYAEKVRESYGVAKKRAFVDGAFEAGVGLIINICLGGILFFGGWLVIKGEITPGTLTSFVLYVLQAAAGFVAISALFADFMKAMGASERVFELLDRVPTVKFEGGQRPTQFTGHVTFENVKFTYPSRLDHPVLKDLTLTLQPGKTLALVGPSGGGKSTIAHLLLGLYNPTEGEIKIDGISVSNLEPSFIRQHVAVVSQEPTLFACSIRDNICYGVPDMDTVDGIMDVEAGQSSKTRSTLHSSLRMDLTNIFFSPQDKQKQVEEAARKANAHEFISSFPEGYDTMVGERGIRLSGGQKQRIAIARALIKNPKILILDEATSALDSESEHLVQEALDELLADGHSDRAYLVIAHRLSTVKNADLVAVVMDGHIAEQGTHEELLALDGVYKKLVSRQLSQD